jgi:spore coat polysaccharide biosynthesis protein SpsF
MKRIPNIVMLIQARTASSRLPNKVMHQILGKPILTLMLERVQFSRFSNNMAVATTSGVEDNIIERLCIKENIKCFRGHSTDLLDRHYKAAIEYNADIVVKIPSDCPLIDSNVIDRVIEFYLENQSKYDYVSNLHPASYPDGNDVEVFSFSLLRTSWKEASKDFEREHTTPFIWDNPGRFRIGNVLWESGLDYSMKHRWTLDYPADYHFIKAVYEELYEDDPLFGINDIIRLTEKKPWIKSLNEKYIGNNWYRNHLNDLKTIKREYTKVAAN